MVRAFVLYEGDVDPDRYAQHVELCRRVPADAFRHGHVFGSPAGAPKHRYYAEFEWADMDGFKAAARDPVFAETAQDAEAMGVPFSVEFAELSG
jgi:hypothetical protein